VIDGYATTTLSAAISSTQKTLSLADGSKFPEGSVVTVHDQSDPASEEQLMLPAKSGNSYSNVQRGWNGTPVQTHSSGAVVVLGGNQLTVNGDYLRIMSVRITNSNPVRVQNTPNSQNGPHVRGEGIFNLGVHNEFINLIIDNNQDGIFNGAAGVGPLVYGSIVFNNGYVAGGAYNGHGLYLIHENVSNTCFIKENIVFNNSSIGIKGDSQNGDTVNIWSEGNVSFNSGSWAQTSTRKFNLLMSSNNGSVDLITVKDNFLFHPNGINGTNLKLGLGELGGASSTTGNYIAHGIPVSLLNWTPVTFTGNTIRGSNNTGGGNSSMILYEPNSSATVNWNNNSYYNSVTDGRGYYPTNASSSRTFAQWKSDRGFDLNSTQTASAPSSNWIFVRPNAYDSNRANIVIYNWVGSTSVSVNVSGILSPGDSYSVYSVENYLGSAVVSGTYTGGTIAVPMNSSTVAQPVGLTTTIVTMRPNFGAFVLIKGTRPF
jgi:hypothetical protein